MGMALRGRRSEREADRGGERPPSPIISLIPEIRFWVSIRPKIKGSLFHCGRDGSRCNIFLENISSFSEPVCVWRSVSSFSSDSLSYFLLSGGTLLPSVMGLLIASFLCNTTAGKLHLCKCHTEWKDRAGIEPRALQGHTNSAALGSRRLDEVPKAFWWG